MGEPNASILVYDSRLVVNPEQAHPSIRPNTAELYEFRSIIPDHSLADRGSYLKSVARVLVTLDPVTYDLAAIRVALYGSVYRSHASRHRSCDGANLTPVHFHGPPPVIEKLADELQRLDWAL
jgi:hypothetical protein